MLCLIEYENFVKMRVFEVVVLMFGVIVGFLCNVEDYKVIVDELDFIWYLQVFILVYEGYFQFVQVVFEFYEVRIKDVGCNLVIQCVFILLGVSFLEFVFIMKVYE